MMWGKHLHIYPIVLTIFLPISFIITYGISVAEHHLNPDFPYISTTGTTVPESCVFSLFLNIYAVIASCGMYIRYRQQAEYYNVHGVRRQVIFNKIVFGLGLIASFGVSVVGDFQETNVPVVHLIGACLGFLIGGVYLWCQTIMSYRSNLPGCSRPICHMRLILSLTGTVFFATTVIAAKLAGDAFHGKDIKFWNYSDGGFKLHLFATASEWIMAVVNCIFWATLFPEFRQFTMNAPVFVPSRNQANSISLQAIDKNMQANY